MHVLTLDPSLACWLTRARHPLGEKPDVLAHTLRCLRCGRFVCYAWTNQCQDAVTAAAKIRQARDNALTKMREEVDARAAVRAQLAGSATKQLEDLFAK